MQNTYYTPGRQEAEHLEGLARRVAGPGLGAGLAEGLGAAAGVPVARLPPFLGGLAAVPGVKGERPEGLSKGNLAERRLRVPLDLTRVFVCINSMRIHPNIHPPPAHSFILSLPHLLT